MTRPILETLRSLEGGTFLEVSADQLAALVLAVDQTGKPGKLTLEITVRKASSSALALKGKITAKMPPENPVEALMFPTPEGNLLLEDPRQGKLPLAAVASSSDLPVAATKSA